MSCYFVNNSYKKCYQTSVASRGEGEGVHRPRRRRRWSFVNKAHFLIRSAHRTRRSFGHDKRRGGMGEESGLTLFGLVLRIARGWTPNSDRVVNGLSFVFVFFELL